MKKISSSVLAALTFCSQLAATEPSNQWIEEYIAAVPDFPKPGISFKCYPDLVTTPSPKGEGF